MIFGNPQAIAIEVGELDSGLAQGRDYVQLRFLLFGNPIGDWEDRIPLLVATGNMKTFLSSSGFRQDESLAHVDSESFFTKTFTNFYEYDYQTQPVLQPNLRDRHHLSEVGGVSICDKYAIVVADVAAGTSRVVAKDLRKNIVILDECVNSGEIEEMGSHFLEWGERIANKPKA